MKSGLKILALVAVVICVFIGGAGYGYMKATDKLNKYYSTVIDTAVAGEIQCQVQALQLLKEGNNDKAQKQLEAFLDVNLGALTVYVNSSPTNPNVAVVEAIKKAKKYRDTYPEHIVKPTSQDSVKKTFDFVKDK